LSKTILPQNMSELKSSLQKINDELSATNCRLVAVSKTKPNSAIMEAYEAGQRVFGENKVQELVDKYESLPKDIEWHYIGHLQTNKVKYLAPFISLIHAIDSLKLLKEVNKRAKNSGRVIDCLFQLHIAQEDTKFGLDETELYEILESETFQSFENINMKGVMGMATYTSDEGQIRDEFRQLKKVFDAVKANYQAPNINFEEISMGMSGDYPIAIEEGSTLIRLGSLIFGARNYA